MATMSPRASAWRTVPFTPTSRRRRTSFRAQFKRVNGAEPERKKQREQNHGGVSSSLSTSRQSLLGAAGTLSTAVSVDPACVISGAIGPLPGSNEMLAEVMSERAGEQISRVGGQLRAYVLSRDV
jgi:hypothetical protein